MLRPGSIRYFLVLSRRRYRMRVAALSFFAVLLCWLVRVDVHLDTVGMFTAVLQRGTSNASTRAALWLLVSIALSIVTCTAATRSSHATMSGAGQTHSTDGPKVLLFPVSHIPVSTYKFFITAVAIGFGPIAWAKEGQLQPCLTREHSVGGCRLD